MSGKNEWGILWGAKETNAGFERDGERSNGSGRCGSGRVGEFEGRAGG